MLKDYYFKQFTVKTKLWFYKDSKIDSIYCNFNDTIFFSEETSQIEC